MNTKHIIVRLSLLLLLLALLTFFVIPVLAATPTIVSTNPTDGAINVTIDSSVSTTLNLPNVGGGVDTATMTSDNVYLHPDGQPTQKVAANLNTTGGGDSITLVPTSLLAKNTTYHFVVTAGLMDTTGEAFAPYTMSFTTGDEGDPPPSPISFDHIPSGASAGYYTSLVMGPDNRLYASTILGEIKRWDIDSDGTLRNEETIFAYDPPMSRNIIGMDFDPASTAANPIIWFTHNYGPLVNAPNFSGGLAQLSYNGATWDLIEAAYGFPRSLRDHLLNSAIFGPDGALYILQGSVSAMGDRDNAWGQRAETLLSASLLRVDTQALLALPNLPLDVTTGIPEASGDVLDENNYGFGDPELEFIAGVGVPAGKFYDPQAAGAPITIYASGIRNAYDMVWHSNGQLYVPTNGSAGGGNSPGTPVTLPNACASRIDNGIFGIFSDTAPAATNITTQNDYLFRVEEGGYYGHPNPTRCEWILNGGNPTSGDDAGQVGNHYAVGTQPDRNWRGFAYDFEQNKSPNGVIEYQSNTFNGALEGKLLVVRYSAKDDILVLEPGGSDLDIVSDLDIATFDGFADPLDIVEDTRNGNLYVSEYAAGSQGITLLRALTTGTPEIDVTPVDLFFGHPINAGWSSAQSVRVANVGNQDLVLNSVVLDGVDVADFQIENTPATTLAPGETTLIDISFNPDTVGTKSAVLRINSNDSASTNVEVILNGLAASDSGGSDEPSLQAILDTFGIPVNTGDDDSSTTAIHSNSTTAQTPLLGEAVPIETFQKAGSGAVTIQVLAAYAINSAAPGPVVFGWHPTGDSSTLNDLFVIDTGQNQTLSPTYTGSDSFNPGFGVPFSFYSMYPPFGDRYVFTEDALQGAWAGSNQHHVRVYPYKNSSGIVVPNSYIFATEDFTDGWDFNDIVVVVSNIEPASTIDPPGNIVVENLQWETLNTLNIEEMDYVNTWMTFHQMGTHGSYISVSDTGTLRIYNTHATNTLNISSLILSDTSLFEFPNGETSLSIPPSSFYDLDIRFIESSGSRGNRIESLTIISNDADDPVTTITLAGSYMVAPEGSNEGTLAEIIEAFGYTTDIGWTVTTHPDEGDAIPSEPVGEEVFSARWERLDPSEPVYVRQIAAFHGCCSSEPYVGVHVSGVGSGSMRHEGSFGQTLLPALQGTTSSPTEMTLNPGGDFKMVVDGRESCDGACTLLHGLRYYPVRNPNGEIVPGAYIVGMDIVFDPPFSSTNYDYQDNVFLITNIQPLVSPVDMVVTATDVPDPVAVNGDLDYYFEVTNDSLYTADNVQITIDLDDTLSLISATPAVGSCSGTDPITCNLGSIAGGASIYIDVKTDPSIEGNISSSALVSTSSTDNIATNNTTVVETVVLDGLPGTLTIVKETTPELGVPFNFTGDLGSFQLVDNNTTVASDYEIRINFQPEGHTIPTGYEPDYGYPYGLRANGEQYGWFKLSNGQTVDATGTTRNRTTAAPTELDTLNHFQHGDNGAANYTGTLYWEFAIPNGEYEVTISLGDASLETTPQTNHGVTAEGIAVISDFIPNDTDRFVQGTATVTVSDGRMTVAPTSNGVNVKINYIIIRGTDIPANQKRFSVMGGTSYNITEEAIAGWTLDSVNCVGASSSSLIPDGINVTAVGSANVTCTFNNIAATGIPVAADDSATTLESTDVIIDILANDTDDGTIDVNTVDLDTSTPALETNITTAQGTYTYVAGTGVTFSPAAGFSGTATQPYTVLDNDGLKSNIATISTDVVGALCSPLTPNDCTTVPVEVTPEYCLAFDAPTASTIADQSGNGTGFTMVLPRSKFADPATPSVPTIPGYEPSRIDMSGGALTLTSGKGLPYITVNTQINALGVGVDTSSMPIEIEATVVNPDFSTSSGNNFQQAGIWFGTDEDNYIRLVLLKNDTGARVEITVEEAPAGAPTVTYQTSTGTVPNIANEEVLLNLVLDPLTNTVSASYSLDGGTTMIPVGSSTISASMMAGVMLPDGTTGPVSYAGVFTSHRNAPSVEPIIITFDDFCVRPNGNIPPETVDDTGNTPVNVALNLDILANDQDLDGTIDADTVDLDPTTPAIDQTLTVAEGEFVYDTTTDTLDFTPATDFTGTVTIEYTVQDDGGATSLPAEITITVAGPPVIQVDPTSMLFTGMVGGGAGPAQTITVTNIGETDLTITSITLIDTNADQFQIVTSPTLPLVLAASASDVVEVAFNPTAAGLQLASVEFVSDDPVNPTVTVELRGTASISEPSLQTILDLYNVPVNAGDDDPATPIIHSTNSTDALLGEEIDAPTFISAGGVVTVEILATNTLDGTPPVSFGWYDTTTPGTTNEAFAVDTGSHATITPAITGSTTFDPGAATFGLYSLWQPYGDRIVYSQDILNTWDTNTHKVRIYPYKDSDGNVVPNSYIYAVEQDNTGENDFNDLVLVIHNVIPTTLPNQPPVLDAIGDQTVTVGTTQTVSITATDPDLDTLTLSTSALPAGITLTDNGDGTGSLDIADTIPEGVYSITVTVTDIDGDTDFETFNINVTAEPCSPISTNGCDTIEVTVAPQYCTVWDGTDVGLTDQNGVATGFTMVDPASFPLPASSVAGFPSYDPSLLTVDTANQHLIIQSTPGLQYRNPAASSDTNSQINALGVAIDADFAPITLTTTVVNPAFPDNHNWEQAGIWFGLDEDNFVKFVVFKNEDGAGSASFQIQTEQGATITSEITSGAIPGITTSSVTLRLTLDPTTNTAFASYELGTSGPNTIGTATVPASYFTGTSLPDGSASGLTYAGIFTSNRRSANSMDFRFSQFCVESAATNFPPIAEDDTATTVVDTPVTIDVLANDSDPNGDLIAINDITILPTNGTANIVAGGVEYTPNAGFIGVDSFQYEVCDSSGISICSVALATITVTAANNAPVGVDDTYTTPQDTVLNITDVALGILNNDTDADADPLTAVLDTDVASGALVLNTDGTFSFTPAVGFTGDVTFTYVANDGTVDSNVTTVVITVTAANNAPVGVDDAYTTPQDTVLNITDVALGILNNDTDADADPLTAVLDTDVASGALVLNTDGTFSFTPAAGFNGVVTFTYVANDGTDDSNVTTVVITVGTVTNTAPAAVDDAYTTPQDTALNITDVALGILNNDTDAEFDTLTAVQQTSPASGILGLNADGTFTYTPNAGFTGVDTFTYVANDGTVDSLIATVTITVGGTTNTAPVAVDDAYTTPQDTILTIDALTGVLNNDTDADTDPLTVALDTDVASGVLVLNADGSFTYTPNAGFTGDDTFTYVANDGTDDSNIATVTITVGAATNTAPVAVDDTYTTPYETALTIADVANGILNNDTDADTDPLTAVLDTDVASGALVLNTDGTFSFTPAAGFSGDVTFTYIANDGTDDSNIATVTITVGTPGNTAPVAVDDTYTTPYETALTIADVANGILNNDTDVESDPLTAVLDTDVASGALVLNTDGTFSFTPDAGFTGAVTFTYIANDGTDDSNIATVTITVEGPVNTPPVAANDAGTVDAGNNIVIDVLANDTDAEGNLDATTVGIVANAIAGTLSVDPTTGQVTYTNTDTTATSDVFTYLVQDTDGAVSNVATVNITINSIVLPNNPPVANDDTATVVVANGTINIGVLTNDTDADGDTLTITGVTPGGGFTGALAINGNVIDYTPDPAFTGAETFTYQIDDGNGGTDTATVTVTAVATNNPPVANDDTASGSTNTDIVIDVLSNDTEPDGDALTITQVNNVLLGDTVNITGGTITFSSAVDGSHTFDYEICDPSNACDTATVTVTLTLSGVNNPPVAQDDSDSTTPDTTVAINVLNNDSDPDGDTIFIFSFTQGSDGSVIPSSGQLAYTPDAGFTGTDTFQYTISDGNGEFSTATVTVDVNTASNNNNNDDDDNDDNDDNNDDQQADVTVTYDPSINVFDPAISKIGLLLPGQLGVNGEQLEWVVTVRNPSGVPGVNVVVSDTLRNELRIDDVQITSGPGSSNVNGQTVTVTIPVLNPGEVTQFSIFTTVISGGATIENTAILTADNLDGDPRSATAVAISTLPLTGESPWSAVRPWILLLASVTIVAASGWVFRSVALRMKRF